MTPFIIYCLTLLALAFFQVAYVIKKSTRREREEVPRPKPISLRLDSLRGWQISEPLYNVQIASGILTVPGKGQPTRALCKLEGPSNYRQLIVKEDKDLRIEEIVSLFHLSEISPKTNLRVATLRIIQDGKALDFICDCEPISSLCVSAGRYVSVHPERTERAGIPQEVIKRLGYATSNLLEVTIVVVTSDSKVVLVEEKGGSKKKTKRFDATFTGLVELSDWATDDYQNYNGVITKACRERALYSVVPFEHVDRFPLDKISIDICGQIESGSNGQKRMLCAATVPVTSKYILEHKTAEAVHFGLQTNKQLRGVGEVLTPDNLNNEDSEVRFSEEAEVILERLRIRLGGTSSSQMISA